MYQSAAMIARRWFEEVWNDNRDAAIDELMHPQAVFHMEGSEVRTPGEFRQMRDAFMSAFPGLRIEIEDVVSNGEHAVVRWHFHGAHNGSGFGECRVLRRDVDAAELLDQLGVAVRLAWQRIDRELEPAQTRDEGGQQPDDADAAEPGHRDLGPGRARFDPSSDLRARVF